MKNIYKIFTAGTVVTLLLFNSCVPEDVIVEDLSIKLTSGSWTFNSVDAGSDFLNAGYEIAYGNNVINFNSDGSLTDTLLKVEGTGTWFLNGNQDNLTLNITYVDDDTRNETWRIVSITDTELVYEFDISPNTLRMRYVH